MRRNPPIDPEYMRRNSLYSLPYADLHQSVEITMPCIWCKEDGKPPSKEHIIPEALGCPLELVLANGEVCKPCNNTMAFLDRALVDDLDIPTFQAGVPRKRGRPPRIDSRGNMVGYHTTNGPITAINMDPHPVTTPEGVRVAAFGGSSRNIRTKLERSGNNARLTYEFAIGTSPLFSRGIHKIALNATAYFLGRNAALDPQLDPVREFVRKGAGNRRILAFVSRDSEYRNTVWEPYRHKDGFSVVVRLVMVEFVIDLSPTQSALPPLTAELERTQGKNGFSLLPPT